MRTLKIILASMMILFSSIAFAGEFGDHCTTSLAQGSFLKTKCEIKEVLLVSLVLAGTSVSAFARHDSYNARARVISVTPQVERVNSPTQECSTEYVRETYYENNRRSNTGAIIGGIAGGVIGSRFGGGNGRIATTALGAGIGAVIGDRHDNRNSGGREHVETRPVERCVTVDNWHSVTNGYLVDYEYHGRRYTTETHEDPGRYIPIHVDVRSSGYVSNVWHLSFNQHKNHGHRYGYHKRHHAKKHYRGHGKKHYRSHAKKHQRKHAKKHHRSHNKKHHRSHSKKHYRKHASRQVRKHNRRHH